MLPEAPKDWFEALFGATEASLLDQDYLKIHQSFELIDEGTMQGKLLSKINHQSYQFGKLERLSLAVLRQRAADALNQRVDCPPVKNKLSQMVAHVKTLHQSKCNQNALFQVASQFNLLEMINQTRIPEKGIQCYEDDPTQGPACALSAVAGTMYRNYFVKVDPIQDKRGQTQLRQINCLNGLEKTLGFSFDFQNGYVFLTPDTLNACTQKLAQLSVEQRDALMGTIEYGIQWNTEVTLAGAHKQCVQQIYCSALPIRHGINKKIALADWAPLACLLQDAIYEATLLTAVINAHQNGCMLVYLSYVGGKSLNRPACTHFDVHLSRLSIA
jgi:hypothetical protein